MEAKKEDQDQDQDREQEEQEVPTIQDDDEDDSDVPKKRPRQNRWQVSEVKQLAKLVQKGLTPVEIHDTGLLKKSRRQVLDKLRTLRKQGLLCGDDEEDTQVQAPDEELEEEKQRTEFIENVVKVSTRKPLVFPLGYYFQKTERTVGIRVRRILGATYSFSATPGAIKVTCRVDDATPAHEFSFPVDLIDTAHGSKVESPEEFVVSFPLNSPLASESPICTVLRHFRRFPAFPPKLPEVGVVCLADASLSPGWTECFASEVGPRLILRISDIWPPEMPKLVGMWPLISLRLVKGSLAIVLSFPGVGLQMGAPMPASAQNLRMNGQLWTTSEVSEIDDLGRTGGDARAGQGVNGHLPPVLPTWKVFEFGIFAFSIGQLTMSSETHSVEDAGAVPLTLESVEAEANRQRMEAAGKKRVAEKSQAEEQGEKKEKVMVCVNWIVAFLPKVRLSRMFVGLILAGTNLNASFVRSLARPVFNKAWKKELWRDVSETRCRGDSWSFASRNQAVLTDLGSECERPASAVTFVTMRAHLGGLPWKLKKRRFANGCVKRTRVRSFGSSLLASRVHGVSVTCSVGQPHIPEIFRGKRIVQIAPGRIGLRADHRLAFIRAAGVEWPQQMQEYLKNHHIVVEVSDIWRSEVAWSSGRWDGTFCVMATPEQREAIDALKRSRVRVW
ncbi:hypothetical protein PAPYR_8351 [Paratrimastix pyriformis]|uniref:Uncharacterized protein n=1 Tax=Paratrimastix pyriformis TaxID=342808 RepID=A0ABQ8UAY1_9EUKA|nr:hypothetical protein PAPYR_8351 [Paratrimastix pyriformis]